MKLGNWKTTMPFNLPTAGFVLFVIINSAMVFGLVFAMLAITGSR